MPNLASDLGAFGTFDAIDALKVVDGLGALGFLDMQHSCTKPGVCRSLRIQRVGRKAWNKLGTYSCLSPLDIMSTK